jgi:hypothetical protein
MTRHGLESDLFGRHLAAQCCREGLSGQDTFDELCRANGLDPKFGCERADTLRRIVWAMYDVR